ncbi:MAG TPA: heme o synthase [Candidatus Polarisedimenticolaceae bacterium]|nr:heme o synthase [Candidatus Polarisedimenticolaceae bacterium]
MSLATTLAPVARMRDLAELGKPRLSLLVIFTAAAGLALAPGALGTLRASIFLAATCVLVAAANTLNCWIEREIDGLMRRTRNRPLPAGRLQPATALASGLVLAALALGWLAFATNPWTVALGALALVSYVLVYTPLKRLTPWALVVGAVPGALPPLMGWTAAAGRPGAPGWALFGILFCWQLPHFIAIAIYLADDFRKAELPVLPLARGEAAARRWLLAGTLLLLAVSLAAARLPHVGNAYLFAALALGLPFVALAFQGWRSGAGEGWARRVFAYSLVYLPVVLTVLVLDAA